MPKTVLNDQQKRHIVIGLACFESQVKMQEFVKKNFGVELTLQAIAHYDPNTSVGRNLSKDLKELFERERRNYIRKTENVGIKHLRNRLERYERYADKLESKGNIPGAAAIVEQAAKDVGGMYTNKRTVDVKNNDPRSVLANALGLGVEQLPEPKSN